MAAGARWLVSALTSRSWRFLDVDDADHEDHKNQKERKDHTDNEDRKDHEDDEVVDLGDVSSFLMITRGRPQQRTKARRHGILSNTTYEVLDKFNVSNIGQLSKKRS